MSDPQPVNYTNTNGYLVFPMDVDANQLMQDELSAIAASLPGWIPREGHLEVALLESFARMASESAAVAAEVPVGIFAFFGSLVGINPLTGAAAETTTTWTMVDDAGYTVPAGTNVGFQVSGSELILFQTATTFTVPPLSTTATGIVIQAQAVGATNNGIADMAVTLIDSLAFVSSIVSTATTSGGADPETLTDYVNRLSAELQLLTPRPILPADFAQLAANIAGVTRALAVNGYNAPRTFTDGALLSGSPYVTSLTAQFVSADVGRGINGTDIPGSTTVSAVFAPNNAPLWQATHVYTLGQIVVPTVLDGFMYQVTTAGTSGSSQPTWPTSAGTVTNGSVVFTWLAAAETAAQMSGNATATITSDSITLAAMTGQERTVGVAVVDENGNALSSTVMGEVETYLTDQREVNFVVSVFAPTYTTVTVDCNAVCSTGASTAGVQAAIVAALDAYLSPANWAGGNQSPPVWINGPDGSATIRYLNVADVILNVPGVDHITAGTLTVNGGTADVTLSGTAPLPLSGTHVVTVTTT